MYIKNAICTFLIVFGLLSAFILDLLCVTTNAHPVFTSLTTLLSYACFADIFFLYNSTYRRRRDQLDMHHQQIPLFSLLIIPCSISDVPGTLLPR